MRTPEELTAAIRAVVMNHVEYEEDDEDRDYFVADLARLFEARDASSEWRERLVAEAQVAALAGRAAGGSRRAQRTERDVQDRVRRREAMTASPCATSGWAA